MNGGKQPFPPPTSHSPTGLNGRFSPISPPHKTTDEHGCTQIFIRVYLRSSVVEKRPFLPSHQQSTADDGGNGENGRFFPKFYPTRKGTNSYGHFSACARVQERPFLQKNRCADNADRGGLARIFLTAVSPLTTSHLIFPGICSPPIFGLDIGGNKSPQQLWVLASTNSTHNSLA